MSKGLKVSADLVLPLNAVTSTVVVYGGKGMGKTNFGAVLVEEMSAADLRWSVLDPMGVWWGIRHSVDGKGNGVECLILGGAHGDIPIEPTGGAVIADLVADERVNVIIDISRKASGEMWSIGERIRFVADYGKQLYKRQGSLVAGQRREPLCQVIDEAARFMPQMIRSGELDVAKCSGTWAAIVEEGRNVGLGVVMLTQRSARLNKDVAELADVMMAFRTVGPNSLGAVTDWLGTHVPKEKLNEMRQTVRSLPVGSCLLVSPGWLDLEKVIAIRKRTTFDSSATPKPGQPTAKVRGQGARPDLGLYAEKMKETIERAKEDSVPELKKRIRELQAQVGKAPVTKVPAPSPVNATALDALRRSEYDLRSENSDLKRKLNERQRKAEKLATLLQRTIQPVLDALAKALEEFQAEAPAHVESPARLTGEPVVPRRLVITAASVQEPPVNTDVKLRGRSMEMLRACARMYPKGLTEAQVASQSGMKRTGGTFGDYKSLLRTSGSIRIEGGVWFATEAGMQRAGADIPAAPSSTAEVLAMWLPKLRGKARDMLNVLVAHGGNPISREELGAAVGVAPSGGTFGDYLSLLRTADLVITDASGVRVNVETLLL